MAMPQHLDDEIAQLVSRLKELGVPVELPKVNLSVQIPRDLKAAMVKRAQRMNRSLSDVVRLACQEWVDKTT